MEDKEAQSNIILNHKRHRKSLVVNIDITQILPIISDAAKEIVSTILVGLIAWFKDSIYEKLFLLHSRIKVKMSGKPLILIWNDSDIEISETLSDHLRNMLPHYRFVPINTPKDILRYPRNPKFVAAVMFIVTDVTKLSEDENIRRKIQEWLKVYVRNGGAFIGTHDIIYRRTRNEILQSMFGYTVNDFQRVDKVLYVKNKELKNSIIFKDLPDEFYLSDGEVIWGVLKQKSMTEIPFYSKSEDARVNGKPLVLLRKLGDGRLVWLNSADKKEEVAASVSKPEELFIVLLRNCLLWAMDVE
ncbi:hypothetical protein [Pyrococcus kukulkanii]|uniref:hypothetical protein n=1 Tax=Pyrococcus kukulkanii TaxID=1609559 RepID=UPI00356AF57B